MTTTAPISGQASVDFVTRGLRKLRHMAITSSVQAATRGDVVAEYALNKLIAELDRKIELLREVRE